MSVATELQRIIDAKAGLKTAIEAKGVTVSSSALIDAYPALVDAIPSGGGGAVEEKTVNFVDFDGTLVASYTGQEVQALTALPDAPDHSSDEVPLSFDEWNWTLAEIKSNNTSYPDAIITVGANYHTTDGKYHFWFDATGLGECAVAFRAGLSGTVDWGDGTVAESFSSGVVEHTYTNGLKNHCIVDSSSGITWGSGDGINTSKKLSLVSARYPAQATALGIYWCIHLEDMSVPSGVTFFDYTNVKNLKCLIFPRTFTAIQADITMPGLKALSLPANITSIRSIRFTSLTSVFIPGVTSLSNAWSQNYQLKKINLPNLVITNNNSYAFEKCFSLEEATFSNQSTTMPAGIFDSCTALKKANIPENTTTIGSYAFGGCQGLRELTLPANVQSIGSAAFNNVSFQTITSLATTPPTLSSAFDSNTIIKVYVPYSSDHSVLSAYQNASNWSNLAAKMEELPE